MASAVQLSPKRCEFKPSCVYKDREIGSPVHINQCVQCHKWFCISHRHHSCEPIRATPAKQDSTTEKTKHVGGKHHHRRKKGGR